MGCDYIVLNIFCYCLTAMISNGGFYVVLNDDDVIGDQCHGQKLVVFGVFPECPGKSGTY